MKIYKNETAAMWEFERKVAIIKRLSGHEFEIYLIPAMDKFGDEDENREGEYQLYMKIYGEEYERCLNSDNERLVHGSWGIDFAYLEIPDGNFEYYPTNKEICNRVYAMFYDEEIIECVEFIG